jgi:hypothetical protein
MPNCVAEFIPWRVTEIVHETLKNIGHHAGYNTQPLVTLDREEYRNSTIDDSLFLDGADLRIIENEVGDGSTGATRVTPEIVLTIYGSAFAPGGMPQMAIMALLQDTLTALSVLPGTLRVTTGRGMTMRIENAQTQTFNLTGKPEAVFNLEVVFRYLQGSTW